MFDEGTSVFTILSGWKLPDVIKRTLGCAALRSSKVRQAHKLEHSPSVE